MNELIVRPSPPLQLIPAPFLALPPVVVGRVVVRSNVKAGKPNLASATGGRSVRASAKHEAGDCAPFVGAVVVPCARTCLSGAAGRLVARILGANVRPRQRVALRRQGHFRAATALDVLPLVACRSGANPERRATATGSLPHCNRHSKSTPPGIACDWAVSSRVCSWHCITLFDNA